MKILGIDPGTARVGWAVIETNGYEPKATAYDSLTTDEGKLAQDRLLQIFKGLELLISKYHPDVMAIEEIFFAANAKTAIPVGQARGVSLLAAARARIAVVSYTPLAVKRAICGDGHADKNQIQIMVMRIYHLKQIPRLDDTIDALAIAATHAYSYKLKSKTL